MVGGSKEQEWLFEVRMETEMFILFFVSFHRSVEHET